MENTENIIIDCCFDFYHEDCHFHFIVSLNKFMVCY